MYNNKTKYNNNLNVSNDDKIKFNNQLNNDKKEIREQKQYLKEMDRTLKYYQYISSTIPSYMLNKLKNMSNNTGYIWKGIYLYGERPFNKNEPIKMEEKIKDTVYIHEWKNGNYKRYEKYYKSY